MWGKAPEVLARMGDDFLVVAPFDGHQKTRVDTVDQRAPTSGDVPGRALSEVGE